MNFPARVGQAGHLHGRTALSGRRPAPTPPCRRKLLSDEKRCITELVVSSTNTGQSYSALRLTISIDDQRHDSFRDPLTATYTSPCRSPAFTK